MSHRIARRLLLFVVSIVALAAPAGAASTQGLRYPSLTPDLKSVVFDYRGDIWIAPVDGSTAAQRLTIHEEQDTLGRVSPDGTQVAFSSRRNGGFHLFVVPVTGGEPKQITFHSSGAVLCDWSPDGKKLLFMSNRDGRGYNLYEADVEGKATPRRVTRLGGCRDAAYSPDGTRIVFVAGSIGIYQDNYEGSSNFDLYLVDARGGAPRRLAKTPGNERWPTFSPDGRTIRFVAEENGVANFYAMPLAGGPRTQLTHYKGDDVHRPDLAWDHHHVVFELAGRLYTTDLDAPAAKPAAIPLEVKSDVRSSGVVRRTITTGGEQVHVSRDGRRVALTVRGDIWIMPASGGQARRITSGPANDQWPRFSPDGKSIAYFSNERGNNDIFLLDLHTSTRRPLTSDKADDFFHNWSPDGKSLVFCSTRSGNKDLWLLEIASGQLTQLTKHPAADDDPSFSADGRFITFDSAREGSQAIYVMDADGSNVRRVTQEAGAFQVPSFSPDGQFLVFERYNPMTGGSEGLLVSAVGGGPMMPVASDGSTACWSPDGEWIYFTARRTRRRLPPGHSASNRSGIYRVRAPQSIAAGERIPFLGTVEVDRRKELGNLFDETWNALKDGFYDAKMHGVDWNAMRKKYRAMAVDTENKDEFQGVVRQMLAELGASHLGVGGGTRDTSVMPSVAETGQLGLEFEPDPLEDGSRRVAEVLPGGPADQAGLRPGDVVLRIGSAKLRAGTNLDRVLAGTVGKALKISYRPRTEAGLSPERTRDLTPVSLREIFGLRSREWNETCKRRVKEATAGKKFEVGYVHLSQMDPRNLQKFQQAVQRWNANRKVKGMVLDVRNNGGGNIHLQLMEVFFAKPLARVQLRGRPKMTQPALYWDKPVVVLINERSFSDAEVFPFMFKTAGIGKLVGVPTGGGVIGTNNITLSDGSFLRIPRTGFWTLDGRNLEGLGVQPDILVEETVEDRLAGRDPQLAKAVEVVVAEIEQRRKEARAKRAAERKHPKKATPAPQPKPVPQPLPENPAREADARTPLNDARVGEWTRYRATLPDGSGDTLFKVTVIRVGNGVVETETEIESGGLAMPPLPDKMRQVSVLESLPMFGKVLSHAWMPQTRVKGTETDLLSARLSWPDGSEITLHFTNLVPVWGLWKVELHDRIVLEAIEWGAPAAPPPAAAAEQSKPAPASAPREEPKPSTPEKAAAPEIPAHPIHDAKPGEWTKVRQIRGRQEAEITYRVVDVTDDQVMIEITIEFGGNTRQSPPIPRPRREKLEPRGQAEATYGHDTLTVNGKELECIVMTVQRPNGVEEKVWVCPEIPVDGLVKVERDGTVVAELLDWGTDDG